MSSVKRNLSGSDLHRYAGSFGRGGWFLLPLLLLLASGPAAADIFNVDVGTDNGQDPAITDHCAELGNTAHCGLRAAITVGNARAGAHTINLSPGVLTITVVNGALPTMMAQYTVNGNHITTINGNGHGCITFTDSGTGGAIGHDNGANGSTFTNLVIGNCSGDGMSGNGHGFLFSGNYVGVDRTGLLAMPNTGHGISLSASHVYPDTSTNFLLNLYSSFPLPPDGASTIAAFSSNLVTATASLSPVTITGNVISGNAQNGIELFSENLAAVFISGNKIGTDLTGNVAIPNGGAGVHLVGDTFGNMIGPDNIISGNGGDGVRDDCGTVLIPNFVMGNRIGLAATLSSAHIGNGTNGVRADTKPSSDPARFNPSGISLMVGPANVISDNKGANNNAFPDVLSADSAGVLITGASSGVKVVGNTIGMAEFPSGTPLASKSYGNAGDGVIVTVTGNTIGGSSAANANIIAGNVRHGIVVSGSSTTATSILGNYIGVHPSFAGNFNLGNGVDGIHIDSASSTTVGGPGATDFNTIAGNGRNGLKVLNGGTGNGWSNMSQRNRIYHNAMSLAGVGIDLDYQQNAVDPLHSEFPQNYVNLDQAPPVICSGPGDTGACSGSAAPLASGGNTSLDWTIATHGPANFRMEFFKIDGADDNAATAMTFLGEQLVSTDLTGAPVGAGCASGRCSVVLAAGAGGGKVMMTATDITPLTDQPGGGSDWKSNLKCFIGDLGIILSSCNVNDTSEYSNVASVPAAAPSPVTGVASSITTTGATLNGTVSSNGAQTTVTFDFGTAAPAYGGAGSPATAAQSPLAAGATGAAVTYGLSGLTCGTTYHFRVNANNGIGGTVNGSDQSFTTAPCAAAAPTVATVAATLITTTTATLNGTVSSNGATTAVTFDYGLTTPAYGGAGSPVSAGSLSSGAVSAPVSASLTGLTCNTTYHFRANGNNGVGGVVHGSDLSFVTAPCAPSAPTAATAAATGVTGTAATLHATVSANGATTVVSFDYGLSAPAYGGLGSPAAATQSPLSSGSSGAAVSVSLSGLLCNTTYHFRVNANNGVGGTVSGSDMNFTTAACAPTATTAAATNVTTTGATLNGTVSANGTSTSVTFDFGASAPAYGGAGSPATATQSPLPGSATSAPVTYALGGLTCNSTYHFRVNANNGVGGTVNGNDQSFTTAPCAAAAPAVTTVAATLITATSATLHGTVTANGATTTVTFDYGLASPAYGGAGSPVSAGTVSSGSVNTAVQFALSGLTCNTTYHFRVNGNNGVGGTINGGDLSFLTAACPVATVPSVNTAAATGVTATGATLSGTVSAHGALTVVTFEYGTTTAYGAAGSPAAATQSPLAAGSVNAPVSVTLSNLSCNTTYHFRADANNGVGGTVGGSDLTFKTAKCPTTTALSGHTPNPSTTLQAILITASVTVTPPAAGTPSGTITVSDGTGDSCVIALPGNTTCNLFATSAGVKTLTATYSGDAVFAGSASAGVGHTVNAVTNFSGPTATGTGTAVATVSGAGCTFTTAQFVPVAPLVAPGGVTFPHGLFDFRVGGCGNAGTATVQVVYPQTLPAGTQYWKYGPTPGPVSAHWYALGAGAPNNYTLAGNTVTFTITDGLLGDDDLATNGTIVDQGGVGVANVGVVGLGALGVIDVPTLGEWATLLLAGLLALAGGIGIRRRRA